MYPAEYQRYSRNSKTSFTVILIWLISATLTIPVLMGKSIINVQHCWLENPEFMLYSSFLSFYIPAIVLTMMYVKLFRKIRKRKGIREALRAFPCSAATTAPFRLPLPMPLVSTDFARENGAPKSSTTIDDDPSAQLINRTDSSQKMSLIESNSTNNMQITSISSSSSQVSKLNHKLYRKRSVTVQNLLCSNNYDEKTKRFTVEVNNLVAPLRSPPKGQIHFEDDGTLDYENLETLRPRTETMPSKNASIYSSNDDYRISFRSSFDTGHNVAENGKYLKTERAVSDLSGTSNSAFKRLVKGLSSAVKRLKDPTTMQRERKATKLVAVVLGMLKLKLK